MIHYREGNNYLNDCGFFPQRLRKPEDSGIISLDGWKKTVNPQFYVQHKYRYISFRNEEKIDILRGTKTERMSYQLRCPKIKAKNILQDNKEIRHIGVKKDQQKW